MCRGWDPDHWTASTSMSCWRASSILMQMGVRIRSSGTEGDNFVLYDLPHEFLVHEMFCILTLQFAALRIHRLVRKFKPCCIKMLLCLSHGYFLFVFVFLELLAMDALQLISVNSCVSACGPASLFFEGCSRSRVPVQ
jgi:hypothetical protein